MRYVAVTGLFVTIAACGAKRADGPARPAAAVSSDPVSSDPVSAAPCDEACTIEARCFEEVNGPDSHFRDGGACVEACEEMPVADRDKWVKERDDADKAKDCKRLFPEDGS